MSGLYGLLDLGAAAMAAENVAVATTGRNTANLNTVGYQRESVDLLSQPGAPSVAGVRAGGLLRADDDLLSGRERGAAGSKGSTASLSAALASLEKDLTPPQSDLMGSVSSLFGSFVDLSAAPLDDARRAAVLARAGDVAASFRGAATAVASARSDANARLGTLAQQANALAAEIASANQSLSTDPDPVMADRRDLAAKQLAGLVGGQSRIDPDGKMRVVVGQGTVLVDGDRAATLQATPDPNLPTDVRIQVVDGARTQDVTATLDGGSIAGEIAFRDGPATQAKADLDNLASALITQVNATHVKYAGKDGVVGRNLFVPAGGNPALGFAVDPAVLGNPKAIAAGGVGGGVGDNAGAAALVALRDLALAGGGTRTFSDEAIHTVSSVGTASASAQAASSFASARADTLSAARDSVSGVSSEEELQKLSQYQHAHEAAQQFVSTVNSLLDNLIQKL